MFGKKYKVFRSNNGHGSFRDDVYKFFLTRLDGLDRLSREDCDSDETIPVNDFEVPGPVAEVCSKYGFRLAWQKADSRAPGYYQLQIFDSGGTGFNELRDEIRFLGNGSIHYYYCESFNYVTFDVSDNEILQKLGDNFGRWCGAFPKFEGIVDFWGGER